MGPRSLANLRPTSGHLRGGGMMVSRQSSGVLSYLAEQSRLKCLWRELVAQAVTVVSVVLVALGYASPPDPTWIDGLYDDAGHDDVMRLLTDGMDANQSRAPGRVEYAPVGVVQLATLGPTPSWIVRGRTGRDPPSATRCLCLPPASLHPSPQYLLGRLLALQSNPFSQSEAAILSVRIAADETRVRGPPFARASWRRDFTNGTAPREERP
jgi:hypothetical protein